jgi:hypothetical protein
VNGTPGSNLSVGTNDWNDGGASGDIDGGDVPVVCVAGGRAIPAVCVSSTPSSSWPSVVISVPISFMGPKPFVLVLMESKLLLDTW